MANRIVRKDGKVTMHLDPDWVINKPCYAPVGSTVSPSGMSIGQALEALALVQLNSLAPHMVADFHGAHIRFEDGQFVVTFAETLEAVLSDVGK